MIESIQHIQVAIPPDSEAQAVGFYRDLLKMGQVEKPVALRARGGCWFRSGSAELHCGVETNFQPARKAHSAFVVADLDLLRQRLREAAVEIIEDTNLPGYARFYAADPFGNRIEFMERIQ